VCHVKHDTAILSYLLAAVVTLVVALVTDVVTLADALVTAVVVVVSRINHNTGCRIISIILSCQ
jgi:hypothetical protein